MTPSKQKLTQMRLARLAALISTKQKSEEKNYNPEESEDNNFVPFLQSGFAAELASNGYVLVSHFRRSRHGRLENVEKCCEHVVSAVEMLSVGSADGCVPSQSVRHFLKENKYVRQE